MLVKVLLTGVGLGEAVVLTAFSAMYFGLQFMESKKISINNQELLNRVIELEKVSAANIDKLNKLNLATAYKRQ